MNFKLSDQENERILFRVHACNKALTDAAQAMKELFSLLDSEYAAISDELQQALSKRIEIQSSLSFRMKVQKVKIRDSGRIVRGELGAKNEKEG